MLTPEYIQSMGDSVVELYSQLEVTILEDMAERISAFDLYGPATQYQTKVLEEMGYLYDDIVSELAKMTEKSTEELTNIMREGLVTSMASDDAILKAAGLLTQGGEVSDRMKAVINAGMEKTNGLFTNLTNSMAKTATQQFEKALDKAYMQVVSGAFDYNTAYVSAIKDLSANGVSAITYPSGRTESVEVAVRRATITGVNQTCLQMQMAKLEDYGIELVEVTAHAGARPSHAEWQGKIYSVSGKSKDYPDFKSTTGYGTGAGLGGWNCSHSFYPYIEGMPSAYSDKTLENYTAENYTYNGVDMTQYEANQQQRSIERKIRQYKRESAALSAAGESNSQSKAKIAEWNAIQNDFLRQTGLKKQASRTVIG